MISAVRRTSELRRAGFTLLEMVVVLSISMLIIGGALSKLYFSRDEAKLTDAYQSVEVLAKRARTISTLQQRPYALEFRNKTVSLMPFAEAAMESGDRDDLLDVLSENEGYEDFAYSNEEQIDRPSDQAAVRDAWVAEPEMMIFIKRWAMAEWIPLTPRDRHVWRFDPSGISEPLGLRFEVDGSWVEVVFHPLTAAVAGMDSEIR
ncbi:type II secretion system protein [Haloferula chungangensis]|uniref:Type II secretion system protein n=1 Tax=Haloferula chungangensis TaxID=1048331 RepID=A0ABW2L4V5_9BACT